MSDPGLPGPIDDRSAARLLDFDATRFPMPSRRISPSLRRATAAALLFALVLAQTLGAMHRIVHAPIAAHAAAAAAHAGATATPSAAATLSAVARPRAAATPAFPTLRTATAPAGSGWLLALFSGHASEQGCDLYDQLSHADGLPMAALASAVAPALPAPIAASISSAIRVRTFAVRARGPPLSA